MDSEEDEFPDSFQRQALEISEPAADFDPTVAPKSGEEYLMHMLWERKRIPRIMVREPKNVSLLQNVCSGVWAQEQLQFDATMPPELRTTPEWKMVQEKSFERTRIEMLHMRSLLKNRPQVAVSSAWLPTELNSNEWLSYCQTNSPVSSVILTIPGADLQTLLEFLRDWLCAGVNESDALDEAMAEHAAVAAAAQDLADSGQWLGRWLYAVLACLSVPLEPAVYSTLREIARVCIRLRSRLPIENSPRVLPYSVFIFLIAKPFGQMDFLEYV